MDIIKEAIRSSVVQPLAQEIVGKVTEYKNATGKCKFSYGGTYIRKENWLRHLHNATPWEELIVQYNKKTLLKIEYKRDSMSCKPFTTYTLYTNAPYEEYLPFVLDDLNVLIAQRKEEIKSFTDSAKATKEILNDTISALHDINL